MSWNSYVIGSPQSFVRITRAFDTATKTACCKVFILYVASIYILFVCMLILVYSAMYTFEGALEKILAEEHCYPQFHAKYFMSK